MRLQNSVMLIQIGLGSGAINGRTIQFSVFCQFSGINRDREVAPTARGRDSEIPPTRKLW